VAGVAGMKQQRAKRSVKPFHPTQNQDNLAPDAYLEGCRMFDPACREGSRLLAQLYGCLKSEQLKMQTYETYCVACYMICHPGLVAIVGFPALLKEHESVGSVGC
jgi:hypothetical protein